MFRVYKKLFAFCIAAVMLSSCIKRGAKDDSSITITIWEQEDSSVAPFIDEMIGAFKALPENKGVHFKRVHYHTEDLKQQFQTASIAGTPPDLLMSPSDTAGIFSVSGFILPVNDIFDLSNYNSAVVKAITLDDKTWGIPISNGNHLMLFFNKKLVSKSPESTAGAMDKRLRWMANK